MKSLFLSAIVCLASLAYSIKAPDQIGTIEHYGELELDWEAMTIRFNGSLEASPSSQDFVALESLAIAEGIRKADLLLQRYLLDR